MINFRNSRPREFGKQFFSKANSERKTNELLKFIHHLFSLLWKDRMIQILPAACAHVKFKFETHIFISLSTLNVRLMFGLETIQMRSFIFIRCFFLCNVDVAMEDGTRSNSDHKLVSRLNSAVGEYYDLVFPSHLFQVEFLVSTQISRNAM